VVAGARLQCLSRTIICRDTRWVFCSSRGWSVGMLKMADFSELWFSDWHNKCLCGGFSTCATLRAGGNHRGLPLLKGVSVGADPRVCPYSHVEIISPRHLYQSQGQSLQLPPSLWFPPLREGNRVGRVGSVPPACRGNLKEGVIGHTRFCELWLRDWYY